MQLRSGRFKWLTPPRPINEVIPNEILEMILLMLQPRDLLRCRAVSKLWEAFATPICRRRRRVNANLGEVFRNSEKTEAFYETFKDSSDLPWSACSLEVYKPQMTNGTAIRHPCCGGGPQYYLSRKQLRRFIDAFGPHLRKLKLRGDNLHTIVPALMEMPNLEVLISDIKAMAKDMRRACSGNHLEFSKLKRLETVVRSKADIQLMELICTNAANLDSIFVNFKLWVSILRREEKFTEHDLRRLVTQLSRIPSIELKLSNTGTKQLFQALTTPELKVAELELKFEIYDPNQEDDYYQVLEQFLAGNSNCLKRLTITGGDSKIAGSAFGPFRVPVLSQLKQLELNYCDFISSSTPFLQPLTENQFPRLVKVMIHIPDESDEVSTTVFGTVQFGTVKVLVLSNHYCQHSNPMVFGWGQIFPNLVILFLNGVTVESHSHIYERMTKLEHLCLRVSMFTMTRQQVAPNRVMCGLMKATRDPATITCGYPKNNEKNETAETRSLASLKNLKTLTLNFGGCGTRIMRDGNSRDSSRVHLALLKLHRLDFLTFQNIDISSEVKQKLSEYHRTVEVY